MSGAIFLDRDGVINENRDNYVNSLNDVATIPGSLEAIARLTEAGYMIIVVSNQAGIVRGYTTVGNVERIHQYLADQVRGFGGRITAFYYCPHSNNPVVCECRKPGNGMLKQAAKDFNIDLSQSTLIGDAPTDIQAGQSVEMYTILVRTGLGDRWLQRRSEWSQIVPDLIVDNLVSAVDHILAPVIV